MSGTPFSNVNNIHVYSMTPEDQKKRKACASREYAVKCENQETSESTECCYKVRRQQTAFKNLCR